MKSIRVKLMLAVTMLLVVFIGLLLLANSVFLKQYYIYLTRRAFQQSLAGVLAAASDPHTDLFDLIRRLNSENGYKYTVVDDQNNIKLSSTPEFKPGDFLPLPQGEAEYINKNRDPLNRGAILYRTMIDPKERQDVVQLTAGLKRNEYLLITQPLRQISENARIANTFFLVIGGVIFVISILVVLVISRRLVRPILSITEIAQGIADLDFTRRYTGRSRDEIGILGQSINVISEKLDSTIGSLQETNQCLQQEMQLQKRFLASVSHEFKTPVGLIRGYGESLQLGMAPGPEEQKEIAGIIIKEADRLNRLVSEIILLMRMESAAFPMQVREFDLAPLLREIAGEFQLPAAEKGASIHVKIPLSIPVAADPDQIVQVLENLFSNSLRHVNEKGAITLTAKIVRDKVRVEVTNTGSRIGENHLEHLFEPFYRAEDSRSRQSGGSGLGLSIVKGIITAHQGECGVENMEDGVLFWFTIPMNISSCPAYL